VSNDIINYYKKIHLSKSSKKKKINTEDTIDEKNNVEDVTEPLDPAFAVFLEKIAKNLKEIKKEDSTETSGPTEMPDPLETLKSSEEPEPDKKDNAEFNSFLNDLTEIIKKEKSPQRNAVIKEATINFIEKLKNSAYSKKQESETEDTTTENEKAVIDESIEQEVFEQETDKEQESEEDFFNSTEQNIPKTPDPSPDNTKSTNNPYVDELKAADKVGEKIKKTSSIKEIVAEQITEYIRKHNFQFPNYGFHGESGGGTNAVQFANGGTMNGDLTVNGNLNVSGKYLSGGVELVLNSTGNSVSGNSVDRLISGPNSLVLNSDGTFNIPDNTLSLQDAEVFNIESKDSVLPAFTKITLSPYGFFAYDGNSNSITFDSIDNDITLTTKNTHEWKFNSEGVLQGPNNNLTVPQLCSLGRILSGDKDLADIFLTKETDSQTLSYNTTSFELTISNGNTLSLSSLNNSNGITAVISNSANWQTAYAYVSANSINLTATNIFVNNDLVVTNTVSAKYYRGTLLDWMALVRGYKTVPTLLQSLTGGDVYTYVYSTTGTDKTYYRYVATDGSEDSFYGNFASSSLSDLIARKAIIL